MNRYYAFVILLVASFFLSSCGTTGSDDVEPKPQAVFPANESKPEGSEYRADAIGGELYLKTLFNDLPPFGPFQQYNEEGTTFVHFPEGRPRNFFSAQQIYKDTRSDLWFYSDNYIKSIASPVDFSGVE